MNKKYRVLMCGSDFSVGGGVIAVTKNYLDTEWGNWEYIYVATQKDGNGVIKLLCFLKGYLSILILLLRKKIDFAHLQTTENGSFFRKGIILRLLKKHKIPVILQHHIDYRDFYNQCNERKRRFIRKTFALADMNVMLGECYSKWVRSLVPQAKTRVLYNAVNTYPRNAYDIDGKYIMFLGWLSDRKGIYDLLKAIKRIDKSLDENIRFLLCGGEEDKIKPIIREYQIEKRIGYIGWVNKEKKEDLLSKTIIHILPSYREGLPMSVLETMAYGIPNIVSDIPIMQEIITDFSTGVVVKTGNVEQIADAIVRLSKDKNLRKKISENSFDLIEERFCLNKHLEGLRKIYKDVYKI